MSFNAAAGSSKPKRNCGFKARQNIKSAFFDKPTSL